MGHLPLQPPVFPPPFSSSSPPPPPTHSSYWSYYRFIRCDYRADFFFYLLHFKGGGRIIFLNGSWKCLFEGGVGEWGSGGSGGLEGRGWGFFNTHSITKKYIFTHPHASNNDQTEGGRKIVTLSAARWEWGRAQLQPPPIKSTFRPINRQLTPDDESHPPPHPLPTPLSAASHLPRHAPKGGHAANDPKSPICK